MRSLVGLVLAAAVTVGAYYFFLRRAQPEGPGALPTQAISITGVQNDLLAIAQAERVYFAQNGSYASLAELTSSGALTMPRAGRDGYTYSVEATASGFTATARYAGPLKYPTFTIDETMQIRQTD